MKIIIYFFLVQFMFSQDDTAFETIGLNVSGFTSFSDDIFSQHYSIHNGVGVKLVTPYHIGHFYLGTRITSYSNLSRASHNFDSKYFYIGWEYHFYKISDLTFLFGLHFGSFHMDFDHDDRLFYKSENELSTSYQFHIKYTFSKNISCQLQYENHYIYTLNKIQFSHFDFGIEYAFRTPNWLKTFLQ